VVVRRRPWSEPILNPVEESTVRVLQKGDIVGDSDLLTVSFPLSLPKDTQRKD